ncbi:MAG: hypothetical protein WBA12_15185, partial [Catalinimonas sp.]
VMDYRVGVALGSLRRPDPDAVFGTVEDDGLASSELLLTIRGTSDDFKVAYDSQGATRKIAEGLKREGRELRTLFGKKDPKDKKPTEEPPPTDEGEYFDF